MRRIFQIQNSIFVHEPSTILRQVSVFFSSEYVESNDFNTSHESFTRIRSIFNERERERELY